MQKDKINTSTLWLFLIALFLWGNNDVFAQKEPVYTQYMYNIGSFNPGYVGSVQSLEIMASYRMQWLDVSGAPRTIRAGANIPMSNNINGIGFNLIQDALGPVSQTMINGAYSYQLQAGEDIMLSFGINAGGSLLNVDFSKGDFEFQNEPLLNANELSKFYPVIGTGAFMYAPNWYVGLSIPNLLTTAIYDDEVAVVEEDKSQVNFIGGYVFDLSENLRFKPALLVNYINHSPLNVNVSANFQMNGAFTAGLSYRLGNAISLMGGFQVSSELFLGYAYDYTTNGLQSYNNGSHELVLKYYLGGSGGRSRNKSQKNKHKPKQIDTPRFF